MHVVIFRARIRNHDVEYARVAARMRELALAEYGCVEFQSVTEGRDEISLSFWPDEASIRAWKSNAEHLLAQQWGRERWYESYSVQVAEIGREYRVAAAT